MKKLLTVLLTVLMVLTIGTINVLADDAQYGVQVKVNEEDPIDLDSFDFNATPGYEAIYKYVDEEVKLKERILEIAEEIYKEDGGSCEQEPHIHKIETCYNEVIAGNNQEIRETESGFGLFNLVCEKDIHREHVENECYTVYTRQNKNKSWEPAILPEDEEKLVDASGNPVGTGTTGYLWSCTKDIHEAHDDNCYELVEGKGDLVKDSDKYYDLNCNIEPHTHSTNCNKVIVPLTKVETPINNTVTFEVNGEIYATRTVSVETGFKVVDMPENPTNEEGKIFNGWFLKFGDDYTNFECDVQTFPSFVDVTIYAGWYNKVITFVNNNDVFEAIRTNYQLTTQDKKDLNKGKDSRIEFVIEEGDADDTASEAIAAGFKNGEKLFAESNVIVTKNIYKLYKNKPEELASSEEITNNLNNGSVTLSLTIESKYGRQWFVRTYHDGEVEDVPFIINDDTMTFNGTHFSVYSVYYKDVTPKPTPVEKYVAPKTGVR